MSSITLTYVIPQTRHWLIIIIVVSASRIRLGWASSLCLSVCLSLSISLSLCLYLSLSLALSVPLSLYLSFQISSRWYLRARKSPFAFHHMSQNFPDWCCLGNSSNVRLIDEIPFSSFQRRSSSASSFHASLLQAIDGVISLALCPQVVS